MKLSSRVGAELLEYGNLNVEINGSKIKLSGTNGDLSLDVGSDFEIVNKDKKLEVIPKNTSNKNEKDIKTLWGTNTRLLKNMISGLTKPFVKELLLVGYRVQQQGTKLTFKIGYSHDVIVEVPSYIQSTVKGTTIILSSIDKQKLGDFIREITSKKKYNVYSGSGILQKDKTYIRKAVKKK